MPKRSAYPMILFRLFVLAGFIMFVSAACGRPVPTPTPPVNPAVDELMGGRGRAELAARIAQTGRTWSVYSAWGKELLEKLVIQFPLYAPPRD